MSTVLPEAFNKRSFVYRKLSDAVFSEVGNAAIANGLNNNRSQAERSGLLDLSVLPRFGYRGGSAVEHIESLNLPVPAKPNLAVESKQGALVLRLSQKEIWVLADIETQGEGFTNLRQQQAPKKGCYALYNQDSHAWLAMTGANLAETMAKVCGVDLRAENFPIGAIAQTSVARVNVIVVHHKMNGVPCFSIFCDSAAAEYMWDSLLDAMKEFDGEVIGLSALITT